MIVEAESAALRRERAGWDRPVSSALLRTELPRAVARIQPRLTPTARRVLDSVDLIPLDPALLDHAGSLEPATLRSLDAIHVASALLLGDELDALITYDARLAEAARAHGLPVQSPGS